MSTNHRSRNLVFGIATLFAFALAPIGASAQEEEVAVPAPLAAPAVAGTSSDDMRAARALAAERALLSGEMGSLQEEHLRALVAAAPSWDQTSGYGSVEASRAIIAHQALLAGDLGSMQEETLTAVVAAAVRVAARTWDETSGYGAVEASRAER